MSQDSRDLDTTDGIARSVLEKFLHDTTIDAKVRGQYEDNLMWIKEAKKHGLVVGSQARLCRILLDVSFTVLLSEFCTQTKWDASQLRSRSTKRSRTVN